VSGGSPAEAVVTEERIYMASFNLTPGAGGIGVIIFGVVVASEMITICTGSVIHWPFVVGGIVAGLAVAVNTAHRKP
jgi:hypothetical protein